MPLGTLDPLGGSSYALDGRIVTMDAQDTVLPHGRIYINAGQIVAVSPSDAPPPAGFENVQVIQTGGTIYPGLIELHNHLSYNILRLWNVPKQYTNRDQWAGIPAYRQLISGPMNVLGKTPGYVQAIVRYVECKCLLGGVTTSQGIALFSNAGITHFYKGVVRNAEESDNPDLKDASDRIADVDATDASKFFARLQSGSCLLLHLSEGTDDAAHKHFAALQIAPDQWAITNTLAGIHCVALTADDFKVLHSNGGSMIWSPLSNLLLYGQTADVKAAKAAGVLMGIGSDWSPSGSKNLFGELKVARAVSQVMGNLFTDRELLAMATRNAAAILKWDTALGAIEANKRADLLVIAGQTGDPYAHLFEAKETDISLVIIDGAGRYGTSTLMKHFGPGTENWTVGKSKRVLNLAQAIADPVVGAIKLGDAKAMLKDGLHRLVDLAKQLEHPSPGLLGDPTSPQWSLQLDQEEEQPGFAFRPHLPFEGVLTAEMPPPLLLAAQPLSEILGPLELDPLTVADDSTWHAQLAAEGNLPPDIKAALLKIY